MSAPPNSVSILGAEPALNNLSKFRGPPQSTDKLLVIEMNYSGQLYHYLRSEVDLPEKTRLYSRAGGRTFSIKELAKPVIEVAR
jgi:pyruvate/2-oxoacid:ferredoxin oxidoreductase alpha subunit